MSVDEVLLAVDEYACPLVEITGGEPLLQDEVYPLMQRLLDGGHTVMLETGGHRPIDRVPPPVIKVVDVKCPGSGESDKNHWPNLDALASHDEVKFVIADRADYEFARDVVGTQLKERRNPILFSPVHGTLDPKVLSEWVLADRLPVQVQLQLHKFIWHPSTRGV